MRILNNTKMLASKVLNTGVFSKKIMAMGLAVVIAVSLGSTTMGKNTIVDSMDFQGNGIELSLNAAINQAMKNNPTIKENELNLKEAGVQADKMQYDADHAQYDRVDSAVYLQGVALKKLSADYTRNNAQKVYDESGMKVKKDVEQAYFTVLQAQDNKKISEENLQIAKDLYDSTNQKYEMGTVAQKDVLNSQLSYIQAQQQDLGAQNQLKNAKMALNIKLGYDVMTELKLTDTLTYKDYEAGSIADMISGALASRSEILTAQYNYDQEKIQMDIIARQYTDNTFNYQSEKIKVDEAQKKLDDANKNIEMEIRSNYMQVTQKQQEIQSYQKAVEASQKALEISRTSYDMGVAVLTDVQQAQNACEQKKLDYSKALLDYNLAVSQLVNSLGSK